MQKIKTVLASAGLLLPLLSNAHPGDHEHVGATGAHHGMSLFIVCSSIILLLALIAVRTHFSSQSIERARD